MLFECPECGTKNTTDNPPQPNKTYRCGKCGAVITFLQASNAPSEVTRSAVVSETNATSVERTTRGEGSRVSPKVTVFPFESGHYRAQWASSFLAILVIIGVISVWFDYLRIQLVNRVINTGFYTMAELYASDDRQATIWGIYLAVFVITGILFLMWIHRANRNLPSLGNTNLKYSPGWAVGWFFVPIFLLWKPYQVIMEIWKASDPTTDINDSTAWQKSPASSLVSSWWFLLLASTVIGNIVSRLALRAETLIEILTASWWGFVIDAIDIPVVILTMLIVRSIDIRQEKRGNALNLLKL